MEVKVDPGSETNCIPLSHFRCLFPQLCSEDGNLREYALEPTLAQFEAYDSGILHSHGWIMLPTWDIKKFHPARYYVVDREEARILIIHATATWLCLIKVLCKNKAHKIKRQVASVSMKAKEPSDQNNNNFLSEPQHLSEVKYSLTAPQHPSKEKYSQMVTVKQQQDEKPTSQPHSHRRCRKGKPVHREVDEQLDHQSVKSHSFQGSIKVSNVENLLELYPNSFDRLGSLKGEYNTKVYPQQCHQYSMQGGRCQSKARQTSKRPLTTW